MTDHYLPITEAVQQYESLDLYSLVDSGKIRSIMLSTIPGVVLVSDEDILAFLPREDRPDFQQFWHLKGVRIGIREAGRKYKIESAIISRWVKRGLIRDYGKKPVRGGYAIEIDEADVAYCVYIRSKRPGRGNWLFNDNGTPRK